MKVSEIATELGKSNKEIIEFFASVGVTARVHNAKVSDEDADKARAHFGAGKEKAPEKTPEKTTEKATAAEAEKAPVKAAPEKAPVKKETAAGNAPLKEGAPARPEGQRPPMRPKDPKNPQKKKKSIIFVANNDNSGLGQNRPNQRRNMGPRPGQASSRPGVNQVPHKLIKPLTAPSSVTGTSDFRENARKLDEAARRTRNERSSGNETVKILTPNPKAKGPAGNIPEGSAPRGERSDGAPRNPAGNKVGMPAPDGRGAAPERGQNAGGGKGGKFSKDNAPARDKNVTDGSSKDDRRRKDDKDKRSKKDFLYEEEGQGKAKKAGRFIKPEKKPEEAEEDKIKVITLPETLTIKELADKMKIQPSAIIKKLFLQGQIVTVNSDISYEDAENIAMEYEILCEKEVKVDVIEELLKEEEEDEKDLKPRPPVVCVMGHVDHGKTSLLDAIRKTHVTDREAGGITQHIGAYTVNINGQSITFLDTPGHEAFTAMRMRGANSTDIAILVVAADDGVMPQTVEAINHAKAAGIEIIVAVNKIDKPGANIDRVKQEMTEYELIPTDWGGSTEFVPVSAKTGDGINDLLETILLTAEILELKANPNRLSRGLVIEAELDKGRGPVARLLVQKGTLRIGDFISAGTAHGKVRAMIDDKGRRIKEAKPSTPVEILGLSDVPAAGEVFIVHESDKEAKNYADTYIAQNKEKKVEETKAKMSLDDLFNQIQADNLKELNIIVKADVQGSVEAVKQSLTKLTNEEVVVKCIHGGVGAINESDVILASASSAIIIGFNVRPDTQAKEVADREGVEIRLYKVIYQAIEDIEAAMKGMLEPVYEEQVIGHAEVRQIFKASAIGNIAGSYVLDGRFERNCLIRIRRGEEQIYEGKLASLKRFKDDVKEVKAGFECGLVFEGFDKMEELDIVEAYIMVEVPRS
ncbi:MAG: translation initiation factor IF-2 [Lachnospiraceae bacterium]|nr:translation initiation factor IF-2 [Lachnospiraceae bacterium]